ncbi:hypothetical protein GOA59_15360 [Sinorhizobium meliloti]|uniref:Uncharacterized protein n=1 Tax=Rhizobium meliloti TaxID=382 RepID=A0AAW9TRD8_RHIML|nr:hypothetical protein SMB554_27250 [Sinorhizobium meliloti]ASP56138.1 hypothetical protein CDO31_33220 [Sinorhizobium meliloti]ASP76061.1 hypothetical protein CDO28_32540 [Sinorhizobium meliloti]ASP94084.1 hypothetical protein CDO25_23655 [Sinorhizobium meliloti]ASQ00893.1 hypothetical protein CDO24_18665 [Sinorhizobium meliloti]
MHVSVVNCAKLRRVNESPRITLDHDALRSGRPESMNVIDSKKLRRGMRAENRTHFSSSRSKV